jgi:phosphoribosylformimino-5-aminoimidazole carboxamide ribotide isomerase
MSISPREIRKTRCRSIIKLPRDYKEIVSLQIIPAIDILEKKLVRLTRGDPSTKKIYKPQDPAEVSLTWAQRGAKLIHIIDLDAALYKNPNTDLILEIAEKSKVGLQVGGGIRTAKAAMRLLDGGIDRVILGSMPINSPEESLGLLNEYGTERIIIALDHKAGLIMINGWQRDTHRKLVEGLQAFIDQGYTRFLVTNIDRDGTLEGPDYDTYFEIAYRAKVIASGGVNSIQDIKKLKKTGVEATVIGKALYENRFKLEEAMEAAEC